jgi:hypothetical protein
MRWRRVLFAAVGVAALAATGLVWWNGPRNIIGADGRVACKGKPGPFGFEPDEVDEWLDRHASTNPRPPAE